MCGIAGLILKPGSNHPLPARAILDQMRHRGPDDQGYLAYTKGLTALGRNWIASPQNPEVLFLHRRLSILDLSESGWQPMGTPDGRYFITFNGQIYNYLELREELQQLGFSFQSRTDTEVLLAAYAAWGKNAFARFVGMFAVAILDTAKRAVILARDFFGIKPLYYTVKENSFAFASELKALLEFGAERRVNPDRLFEYLRFGLCDYGSETLLSNVSQLAAASYLEIPLDGNFDAQPVRYWKPDFSTRHGLSFNEAAAQLRDAFLRSVRLHLRSDVPVGSALSGGIDSSSVVMAVRHLEPKREIHVFSYVADDPALSEERWIDIVGRAARARVHKVHPTAPQLLADFDNLTYALDWPSGGTSLYAQYCVFRAAHAAGIKVMLDGQGADEILAGYRFFLGARLASLFRQGRWAGAAEFLRNASRWPGVDRKSLLFVGSDYLLPTSLQVPLRKLIGKDLVPAWLNEKWFRRMGVTPHPFRYSASGTELLKESLYRNLTELLPNLLRYEDRNSMSFSVESRVPFLTPEIVNLVFSLSEEYIVAPNGTSKAVFRRAVRGIVPNAILNRRDKIGFNTPERMWLTTLSGWVCQVLRNVASEIPAFDNSAIRRAWERTEQSRRPPTEYVWRCLNVIRWTERFQVQYT